MLNTSIVDNYVVVEEKVSRYRSAVGLVVPWVL